MKSCDILGSLGRPRSGPERPWHTTQDTAQACHSGKGLPENREPKNERVLLNIQGTERGRRLRRLAVGHGKRGAEHI